MRGATVGKRRAIVRDMISIHAPHARSDAAQKSGIRAQIHFNPRSSCEERHGPMKIDPSDLDDFNPRSSCEERLFTNSEDVRFNFISIHAPHARSDFTFAVCAPIVPDFNPRSSCEERLYATTICRKSSDFNPRSSCEERLEITAPIVDIITFQSTLLMRGATLDASADSAWNTFQSTLLMRGATRTARLSQSTICISIHAPHARSDISTTETGSSQLISIHAPHARSDDIGQKIYQDIENFNPRSSCEERHGSLRIEVTLDISIHAPHARSD